MDQAHTDQARTGLRERTRRAIQKEITEAAERLFVERGYEATTIGHIAEAVGMSRRTLYRYFSTREDVVLGKLDVVGDEVLAALRERPADEPVWTALRHSFDGMIAHLDHAGNVGLAAPMQRIILETPGLRAKYLEKIERVESAAELVVRERADAAGKPWAADDPAPRAVVAAALGCVLAAEHAWLAGGATQTMAVLVDRAMAAVGPREPA
ncbi:TetR family transcriptional regulator [Promicromonospora sp. NFX87]|uniref:TetR family transcriptional regulator n=1 Tax=Promicromonospora sp. NFX87 TaxID=3402691 RepID=UPI003AFA1EAA